MSLPLPSLPSLMALLMALLRKLLSAGGLHTGQLKSRYSKRSGDKVT